MLHRKFRCQNISKEISLLLLLFFNQQVCEPFYTTTNSMLLCGEQEGANLYINDTQIQFEKNIKPISLVRYQRISGRKKCV